MLPIEEVLPELRAAMAGAPCTVLVAPPGAGKTTLAPLALIEEPWAKAGRILVLSPRRIAARAAAARMAALRGEAVGRTVGYTVRLDSKVSAATRVEVITEGVFTRRILNDPMLDGVSAVVFDEFHERSLDGDLGLALARDAQLGLREDLRLLVMSATLDAARIAVRLSDAPIVESKGRLYPIAYRYLGLDPRQPLDAAMAEAIAKALAQERGSILAFLPGARDIQRTAARLSEMRLASDVSLHPLFGAMEARDQDAAIAPAPDGKRKVVLATSIAETSLTIEGVRVVIDCGFARQARFEPGLGLSRLETVRASQAAITQRAGRAGRTEAGVCWRLWDEPQTRAFPAYDPPEILAADLANLALDLAAWGVADPSALVWLDPPPAPGWAEAQALLKRLGALDSDGRLTAHGRAIAGFGLPSRLAHMVVAADTGLARTAAWLSVLLTEQGLGGSDADLGLRLAQMQRESGPRATAARAMADRLTREAGADPGRERIEPAAAGPLLALAFPERVAMARAAKPGEAVMANGRAVSIEPEHALAKTTFLVVADAGGRADKARILAAAALSAVELEQTFAAEIESLETCAYDASAQAIRARRVRRLGKIILSEAPGEKIAPGRVAQAWAEALATHGATLLGADEALAQLRARVAFLRGLDGAEWPDWSDAALCAGGAWLDSAAANGASRLSEFQARIAPALRDTLDWPQRQKLDHLAPARFATPAGGDHLIDYGAVAGPTLAVRLQELFGQDRHPTIADGRTPLILELLSPAHRPVQTTRDLPGFWRGSYTDVKAQMKGRYPKHPWPDDPLQAAPTRRAKPRGE